MGVGALRGFRSRASGDVGLAARIVDAAICLVSPTYSCRRVYSGEAGRGRQLRPPRATDHCPYFCDSLDPCNLSFLLSLLFFLLLLLLLLLYFLFFISSVVYLLFNLFWFSSSSSYSDFSCFYCSCSCFFCLFPPRFVCHPAAVYTHVLALSCSSSCSWSAYSYFCFCFRSWFCFCSFLCSSSCFCLCSYSYSCSFSCFTSYIYSFLLRVLLPCLPGSIHHHSPSASTSTSATASAASVSAMFLPGFIRHPSHHRNYTRVLCIFKPRF